VRDKAGTIAAWLEQAIGEPVPSESRASCSNCAMCGDRVADVAAIRFREDVKCCSYWPLLTNFQIGGILRDGGEGADRIRLMLQKDWAQPIGLGAAPAHRILYAATGSKEFGRSVLLRCPYFDETATHSCTVWQHRNAVCSTWFCKYDRGLVGEAFWEAARMMLTAIERSLSIWCARRLGIDARTIRRSLDFLSAAGVDMQSLDGVNREQNGEGFWGSWNGRREEYYLRCLELVDAATWEETQAAGGIELQCRITEVQNAFSRLKAEFKPLRLTTNGVKVLGVDGPTMFVQSYSVMDPIAVERRLFDLIQGCHNTVVEDLRVRIAAVAMDGADAAIQRLCDFGLLRGAAAPADGTQVTRL
jgi:hypothetical protein